MVENLSEKEMTQACKGNVIPGRVAMKVLDLYSKVLEISGEDGDPSVERSLKRAKVVCRDTGVNVSPSAIPKQRQGAETQIGCGGGEGYLLRPNTW